MTLEEYKRITSDANGRKSLANSLTSMQESDGWKILEMVLEDKSRWLQDQINDINNMDEKDLLNKRIQLYYLKELLNMPEFLIKGLLSEKQEDYEQEVYE